MRAGVAGRMPADPEAASAAEGAAAQAWMPSGCQNQPGMEAGNTEPAAGGRGLNCDGMDAGAIDKTKNRLIPAVHAALPCVWIPGERSMIRAAEPPARTARSES